MLKAEILLLTSILCNILFHTEVCHKMDTLENILSFADIEVLKQWLLYWFNVFKYFKAAFKNVHMYTCIKSTDKARKLTGITSFSKVRSYCNEILIRDF